MLENIWDEKQFYGIVDELEEIYNDSDIENIKNKWLQIVNEDELNLTFFKDKDFVRNFIHSIIEEEQLLYIINTIKYNLNREYDSNYVLVARRAIPSYDAKPENFWSTEAREVLNGLRNEIRDEQRFHSVIMVTTLSNLKEHGTTTTSRGCSDGEIVLDPNKSFSNFLFMYKPRSEFYELVNYLENNGINRDELLSELKSNYIDRAVKQGLPINMSYIESGIERKL